MQWLLDKSAYVRFPDSPNSDQWASRIQRGLVHVSTVTLLEIGYSFRSGKQARYEFTTPPLTLMPIQYLTPAIEDRALEIQMLLADRGHHRAPSVADVLLAATAERVGLTVLSVDKDFDLIAEVTGQPIETLRL